MTATANKSLDVRAQAATLLSNLPGFLWLAWILFRPTLTPPFGCFSFLISLVKMSVKLRMRKSKFYKVVMPVSDRYV